MLSLANYARLPAMHGYLHDAQRRLVEKKMLARVWKYWAIENLWGNFSPETDPIGRDNVMYSGWYAAQIGLYEAATGDRSYEAPGAIRLTDARGRTHLHSYASTVQQLAANERSSAFCLFPCEPNWIYPLCNNQAVIGIKIFDRLNGTRFWADVEADYRRHLEAEFVDVDGHMILIRSARTGLTIPGLSSSKEDAIFAFWMHAVFPDLARRAWAIARHELFTTRDGSLALIPLKPWLDPGNYKLNTAYALGALAMAACEMGDTEALAAVRVELAQLDSRHHGGVLSYPGCSTWTHAFMLKSRLGRANALKDLVDEGLPAAWRDGPVIVEAAYPQVLVAKAVSDGRALEAVLHPGGPAARVTLGIGRLRPGAAYRLEGADEQAAVADERGTIRLTVELGGRRELRVLPRD
ncbi:MAG: hypothetical protein HY943_18750 [Gammaproteobacteria bacterium]|nr:hypothetical protein [Gammaproteobacteria bacterium]